MKWMVDLNVVLDVLQRREPFYDASARILSRIVKGEASGCLPAHAVTTIHYIARRHAGLQAADDTIDWLLPTWRSSLKAEVPSSAPGACRSRTSKTLHWQAPPRLPAAVRS